MEGHELRRAQGPMQFQARINDVDLNSLVLARFGITREKS